MQSHHYLLRRTTRLLPLPAPARLLRRPYHQNYFNSSTTPPPRSPHTFSHPPPPPRSKSRIPRLIADVAVITAGFYLGLRIFEHLTPFGIPDPSLTRHSAPRTPSPESSTLREWMLHHPDFKSLSSSGWLVLPSRPPGKTLTSGALRGEKRIHGQVTMLSPDRMESVSLLELGPALCGYPGVIHGGISATVVDEALGRLAAAALVGPEGRDDEGKRPVTARLELKYKKPVKVEPIVEREPMMPWLEERSGALVKIEAKVVGIDREKGKVWVNAVVRAESAEGRIRGEMVLVEAKSLFVVPRGFSPKKIVEEGWIR